MHSALGHIFYLPNPVRHIGHIVKPTRPANLVSTAEPRQQILGVMPPALIRLWSKLFQGLWKCVSDVYSPSPPVVAGALRRRNKDCSTPYRSPGSLQTHSMRRWCHSPCRRAGHSRHTPLTHSSSRNMSRLLHRNHRWRSPARCYTELGTHKRGRQEYSEHSSLQRKR